MASLQKRSFNTPDETRTPPKVRMEIVTFDGLSVVRARYEPGWRWTEHIKPVVGTTSCQVPHLAYVISGQLEVVADDGERAVFGEGDLALLAPGHDAWVIGDDPCVVLDFHGASRLS